MTTAGSEPAAREAAPLSRAERRKAPTRQKLIDAARVMLAAGTAADASIQEITDAADVGFGSFYNHFSSKTELFEAAVADVLEELGALFDRLSVDVEDPALAFAQSTRLTLRLCRSRPQISAVLIRHGMHYMEAEGGVAPRLLRDLQAGMASGRFLEAEPRLARAAVSGAVLATLQMALTHPELVDDDACDQFVEQVLRMLGVPSDDGARAGARPSAGHGTARTPLTRAGLPLARRPAASRRPRPSQPRTTPVLGRAGTPRSSTAAERVGARNSAHRHRPAASSPRGARHDPAVALQLIYLTFTRILD